MSDNDPVKTALETFSRAAKAIGLKGTQLDSYVHEHMTKAGFKAKTTRTYSAGSTATGRASSWLDKIMGSDDDDSGDDED